MVLLPTPCCLVALIVFFDGFTMFYLRYRFGMYTKLLYRFGAGGFSIGKRPKQPVVGFQVPMYSYLHQRRSAFHTLTLVAPFFVRIVRGATWLATKIFCVKRCAQNLGKIEIGMP